MRDITLFLEDILAQIELISHSVKEKDAFLKNKDIQDAIEACAANTLFGPYSMC